MISKKILTTIYSIFVFFLVSLFSCADKDGYIWKYGNLVENKFLEDSYQKKSPLPDFDYYYTGRSNLPYAVIGIDKKYKLKDWNWVKIENKNSVYDKIANLDNSLRTGISNYVFFADIIRKTEGVAGIGIWFSYYTYTVIKVDLDKKIVVVFSPYSPNDSRGR